MGDYDRYVSDWRKATEAVRVAGGDQLTVPALHLALILHGYEALRQQRAAACSVLAEWERKGIILPRDADEMRAALGEAVDQ